MVCAEREFKGRGFYLYLGAKRGAGETAHQEKGRSRALQMVGRRGGALLFRAAHPTRRDHQGCFPDHHRFCRGRRSGGNQNVVGKHHQRAEACAGIGVSCEVLMMLNLSDIYKLCLTLKTIRTITNGQEK